VVQFVVVENHQRRAKTTGNSGFKAAASKTSPANHKQYKDLK
jgi:hypothetical protein